MAAATSDLHLRPVDGEASLEAWRHVHNVIIPTAPLSLDEVRRNADRHHLEVAHLGGRPVGCSTVRPPTEEEPAATVIARVLPEHRGRGIGTRIYLRCPERARETGAERIETIVLASNTEGVAFALAQGFVQVGEYLLPGDTVPFLTLRLP
ncbi:GNAT family N-acetyltransferase [Kitasatospora sp. DSM 101779]|uniref:GNAT family N-acetyltransferase n=1 Tax=Kitasatospora sp. DSM 101779 TaxID=2853165 RepID=UPI0021DA2303|nr:GNAT family N-acetyltransferase [Kitasatospora sp. DSM 101779]